MANKRFSRPHSLLDNQLVSCKRSQLTIFIIIAVLIAAGIAAYFVFRGELFKASIPKEIEPVYNYFLSCIQEEAEYAVLILESQGGWIEMPEFEPGSTYMPFSSQLEFNGQPVQYWYYVSGSGIARESAPTKSGMETEMENYLNEQIGECNFLAFEEQGFSINQSSEVSSAVSISDSQISVTINMPLSISFGEISSTQKTHETKINSRLGRFYNLAKKIYDKENSDLFLENYGVDVLRLYAPVDGVELSCSPKTWIKEEIKSDFAAALQENTMSIKASGSYYSLARKENQYFVQDMGENVGAQGENVAFLYFSDWPTKLEVYPDSEILIANPVGLQQGLGILGFCYTPWHFVYDAAYPVLIQVYDNEESFQFATGVLIQANKPRRALDTDYVGDAEPELCKYKNQEITANVYSNELEPLKASIGFECLGEKCSIGLISSEGGSLLAPGCVNGYLTAEAEGYAKKRMLFSSNSETSADFILDKLYSLDLSLQVDGKETSDYGIISFVSEENSRTVSWPSQKKVELSEGYYNISVYVYKNGKVSIPALNKEQCSEVPKPGLLGVIGMTEEKCFNINLPSQELQNVISAGGKVQEYIIESELQGGKIILNALGIAAPSSLEGLQDAYNEIDSSKIEMEFE